MKKLVWLFCPVIVMVMSAVTLATPPSIPSKNMDMHIDINGTPALGAQVEVVFTFTLRDSITHHGNATDTAWIAFTKGARLVGGQIAWSGRLVNGVTQSIAATLSLDSNMRFCVGGTVKCEGIDLSLLPAEIAERHEPGEYGYTNFVNSQTFTVGELPPQRNTMTYSVIFGDRDSSWTGEIPMDSVPVRMVIRPDGKEELIGRDGKQILMNDTLFLRINAEELAGALQNQRTIQKGIGTAKPFVKIYLPSGFSSAKSNVSTNSKKRDSVVLRQLENAILLERLSIKQSDTIDVEIDSLHLRLISDKLDGYQI